MHASIRRYPLKTSSSENLGEVGWRLGVELAQVLGFVALVAVEDDQGNFVLVSLFDDLTSLAAGEARTQRWTAENFDTLRAGTMDIAAGEVVAQKGL